VTALPDTTAVRAAIYQLARRKGDPGLLLPVSISRSIGRVQAELRSLVWERETDPETIARFESEIVRFGGDPKLRAAVIESILLRDETLPDVENFRARLKG
jgi:hypothetical protein